MLLQLLCVCVCLQVNEGGDGWDRKLISKHYILDSALQIQNDRASVSVGSRMLRR